MPQQLMNFSPRYLQSAIKRYDGIEKGSSTLWAARMSKAYGSLPNEIEHDYDFSNQTFDYNTQQILIAQKHRIGYFKRIIEPEHIIKALCYSPVSLDIEIFNSIFCDLAGCITMPDDEDVQEEYSHSFTVIGYNKSNKIFNIDSNWPSWGQNGLGVMPFDYLRKYFITAFIICDFPNLEKIKDKNLIAEETIKLSEENYFLKVYVVGSLNFDNRQHYNIELLDSGKNLVGWAHCAINKKIMELLDIFVLEEFRKLGVGSFLLDYMIKKSKVHKLIGYISAHDLIGERDEIVQNFFRKNNILCCVDRSQFKDCRYRVENFK